MRPLDVRMDALFDNAASFIDAGGMTWTEYWSTPRPDLDRYAMALERRAAKQRQQQER